MPNEEHLSADLMSKYGWISGSSITHMEIIHGAIRPQSKNAAFFIRDPSMMSDLPEHLVGSFKDQHILGQESLKVAPFNFHFPTFKNLFSLFIYLIFFFS